MDRRMLSILQVNTVDAGGGAESVSRSLFQSYRARGHHSWLAVGCKYSDDPQVVELPNYERSSTWTRGCLAVANALLPFVRKVRGAGRLRRMITLLGEISRLSEILRGREDFAYPGTYRLLELVPERPDIIHFHNLHGNYFDLRALPWLTRQVPTVLTLHDTWLLSGHCAYTLGCERWKIGCGNCPDLSIYPAILRDATAYNWQRKRDLYQHSALYVATPSRWLMNRVQESMLAPAVAEGRVIPYGVDVSIFCPAQQEEVRAGLGLPQNAKVLLFVANGAKRNRFKDYGTVRTAAAQVSERFQGQRVILLVVGEGGRTEQLGNGEIRFINYETDLRTVARYYQAADVYVHAARSDNFPNTVLEALACGIPVVATAVDGIPEQVDDGHTGFLVPGGDAEGMAARILQLLSDDVLRRQMGAQAVEVARRRFDLRQQVHTYLDWYQQIISRWAGQRSSRSRFEPTNV